MLENCFLFKILQKKIDYTVQRHSIIADNIANISTPNILTRDLVSFNKVLKGSLNYTLPLTVTSNMHVKEKNSSSVKYPIIYPSNGTEPKLNGNNISLNNESIKLNRNNLEYKKAIGIYSKILSLFSIVTGSK